MAHTPGPWEFVVLDDGESCDVNIEIRMGSRLGGSNGWEPQHCIQWDIPVDGDQRAEAECNARLIALAPNLLATLKKWVDIAAQPTIEDLHTARALVAKAEGR